MRVFLFNKGNKGKYQSRLPSKSAALKLHIRQAHYQTTICLNVTVPSPEHIDPETCRSVRDPFSNQLKPKLLLQEPIPVRIVQVRSYCNAAAKCVQQDGVNVDLIISIVFRLAAVVLLHVAIH